MASWSLTGALRRASTVSEVVSVLTMHDGVLNAIHVTAAATRLAAFSPCRGRDELQKLRQFMTMLGGFLDSLDVRGVANVMWALGKLHKSYADGGTGSAALQADCLSVAMSLQPVCLRHLSHFSPQHISNIMWALATMLGGDAVGDDGDTGRGLGGPWHRSTLDLMLRAAREGHQLSEFTPQGLSNLLWSCARLGHPPEPEWLADFYEKTQSALHAWPPQSISQSLWALSKLDLPKPPLPWVTGLCLQTKTSLTSFDPQSMANLTWALARMLPDSADLLVLRETKWMPALLRASVTLMPVMSQQQLSNLLWAVEKLTSPQSATSVNNNMAAGATSPSSRRLPPGFLNVASRCVLDGLPSMSEQATACCSWALSRMDFHPSPLWMAEWTAATTRLIRQGGSSQAVSCCLSALLTWSPRASISDDDARILAKGVGRPPGGSTALAADEAACGALASEFVCELLRRAEDDVRGTEGPALLVAIGALLRVAESAAGVDADRTSTEARRSSRKLPSPSGASVNQRPPSRAHSSSAPLVAGNTVTPVTLTRPQPSESSGPTYSPPPSGGSLGPGTLTAMAVHRPMLPARSTAWKDANEGIPSLPPSQLPQPTVLDHVGDTIRSTPVDGASLSPAQTDSPPDLPTEALSESDASQGSLLDQTSRSLAHHIQRHFPRYSIKQQITGLWSLAQAGLKPDTEWLQATVIPSLDASCGAGESGGLSDHEIAMFVWAKARWGLPVLSHVVIPPRRAAAASQGGSEGGPLEGEAKADGDHASAGAGRQRQPQPRQQQQQQQQRDSTPSLGPETLSTLMHALGRNSSVYFGGATSAEVRDRLLHVIGQVGPAGSSGMLSRRNLATCLWASSQLRYRPGVQQQGQLWAAVNAGICAAQPSPPPPPASSSSSSSAGSVLGASSLPLGELVLCLWSLASMRCPPPDQSTASTVLERLSELVSDSLRSSEEQLRSSGAGVPLTAIDACRLLQAVSTWRLVMPPALCQALLCGERGTLGILQISTLSGRQIVTSLVHLGRMGLPLPEGWLSAAYSRATELLPQLNTAQLAALMEATSLLQIGQASNIGGATSVRTTHLEVAQPEGDDAAAAGREAGRELFLAALHEMEVRGLSQAGSCSDDAALLRCLVAHRRQSRWLDAAGLDATLSSFFIISRRRVPSASDQQLLHMLYWLAHLDVSAVDDAAEWLHACSETIRSRFRSMPSEELSYCLLALVRCGYRPTPSWAGLYIGVVLQRMPILQQRQVCRVTQGLAKLDAGLHQRWVSKLVLSYGS